MTIPTSMGGPLEYIGHCLSDISLTLQDIARDQQRILALVSERQGLEDMVQHLERMMHQALMSDEDDDADDALS